MMEVYDGSPLVENQEPLTLQDSTDSSSLLHENAPEEIRQLIKPGESQKTLHLRETSITGIQLWTQTLESSSNVYSF